MVQEWFTSTRLPYVSFTTDPACPLQCNCCPWEVFRDASARLRMPRMLLGDFKRFLSSIPKHVLIDFSGFGESLTNPQTPDMVLWAYRQGYRVQIFTTLVGLTRQGAEKLAQARLEKFMVHLPDKTNFLYDVDKWLAQYALLDGLKFPTLIHGGLGDVDEKILTTVRKRGPVVPIHITDKTGLSREEWLNQGPTKCKFAGERLDQWAIWSNGDVSVCFFDYGHESFIGNLAHQTYAEILGGKELHDYRSRMRHFAADCLCRHCEEAILR